MKSKEHIHDQVTTEPQRQALEAMSEELVRKLNIMVAEQEARAREFAKHQHSLSSLPAQQQPQIHAHTPKPYQKTQVLYAPPPPKPQPEYTRHFTTQHAESPKEQQFVTSQHIEPRPLRQKQPTVIRQKEKQQEEGISATAIIVILLILFSIFSRTCS